MLFILRGWQKRSEDAQRWNCFRIPSTDIQSKIWVRSQEKRFTGQIRTKFIEKMGERGEGTKEGIGTQNKKGLFTKEKSDTRNKGKVNINIK